MRGYAATFAAFEKTIEQFRTSLPVPVNCQWGPSHGNLTDCVLTVGKKEARLLVRPLLLDTGSPAGVSTSKLEVLCNHRFIDAFNVYNRRVKLSRDIMNYDFKNEVMDAGKFWPDRPAGADIVQSDMTLRDYLIVSLI